MEPSRRMSRISGARRRRRRELLVWCVGGLVAVVILILAATGEPPGEERTPPSVPSPSPSVMAVGKAAAPSATPSPAPPSPVSTPIIVTGSTYVNLAASPGVRPDRTPRARPCPTATPAPHECVRVLSAAARSAPGGRHVVVEVEIENTCGRDLEPLDVWVWVGGYREGALVGTARGHPFSEVGAGSGARVTVGLPGSPTWLDRIEARVLPGGQG